MVTRAIKALRPFLVKHTDAYYDFLPVPTIV